MRVDKISLLTGREFNNFKSIIPASPYPWWLRDGGSTGWKVSCVSPCHSKEKHPREYKDQDVSNNEIAVRPTLKISDIDELYPGNKVKIFGEQWTVLQVSKRRAYVLCDTAIDIRCFNSSSLKKNNNDFETSELKVWLEKWLVRMMKPHTDQDYERMKNRRDLVIKYKSSAFLHAFLAPLSAIFFFWLVWLISSVITGPKIVPPEHFWINPALSGALALFIAVDLIYILFSFGPGRDTLRRHIINIIATVGLFLLLYYVFELTLFNLFSRICVLLAYWIISSYLREIKYHS